MTRTALVTDSTANLPASLAEAHRIYVAPLYLLWGDETYRDGVDITEEVFYERLSTSKVIPKTSQVSPQDFITLFEQARQAENADEVVCGVISSDLSGTYASAMQAKANVDFPVHVIDSRQATWGLGHAMLSAAQARDAGARPDEIAAAIAESAARQRLTFTIDSLEFLHRGGRIGNARLLLGSALNVKPVLELRDGVVSAVGNVRTRKRAVEQLLKVAENHIGKRPMTRLSVIHAAREEEAQALLAQAIEQFHPQEIHTSLIGVVLGVHTGPGALGLVAECAE